MRLYTPLNQARDPEKSAELARSISDSTKVARMERIAEIEAQVFDVSTQVVMAHLAFTEVDPDQEEPPEEWVREYGEKAARRRLIVAKLGYAPASQMPSAVKLAQLVRAGVSRAYGQQSQQKHQLNQINVKIALPAPTSHEHPGETVYEVRDLDE